jgi:hypothetical protein
MSSLAPDAVLDRVYLEIRCKLLDIAACLDRVARAQTTETTDAQTTRAERGAVSPDARLVQIAKGIEILSSPGFDRAERIQMLFSDPYIPQWNRREGHTTNGAKSHN